MKYGRKNRVNLNPLAYNICLLGESKVGKTTLVYQMCEKLVGEEGYLFAEIKGERGADAIEGINYINCLDWNSDYDELNHTIGFATLCEDIIENKSTDYPDLKVLVIDTYDYLIDIAEEESIRLYNKACREKGDVDKVTQSINAAWGGYGKGEKKAMALMFSVFDNLADVGVRDFVIGHTKNKEVTDVITGTQYSTITSDQQQNYFNALKKRLHFLGLAYVDRTFVKKDSGKTLPNGKKKEVNKVTSETRRIKFRDDNYAVDSGSRFADIVDEIPMDVDEFIKALTDAIEAESSKSGKSLVDTKKEQDKEAKAKEERAIQAEKKAKSEHELEDAIESIMEFCKENKKNLDKVKPILQEVKSRGYDKPQLITNIEDAKAVLELCK